MGGTLVGELPRYNMATRIKVVICSYLGRIGFSSSSPDRGSPGSERMRRHS